MGCQFFDSLEARLGKHTRNLRPDQTPLTKHHVQINAPNYSRKRQPHSGTVRAERPTGQGTGRNRGYLPLCSSLCYLTPVPRTKQHGRSNLCPCSLENRRRAQLLVLRLVRDPPAGSSTYYSFFTSAEAGLVPHPCRICLNCPSGRPSHPCKYPWLRLHQP